jgi:hypothetical protein
MPMILFRIHDPERLEMDIDSILIVCIMIFRARSGPDMIYYGGLTGICLSGRTKPIGSGEAMQNTSKEADFL